MSAKAFARHNIFRQTTSVPWTKNFRHMEPIPRHWTVRTSWRDPHLKPVKPQDRIKYWNIVPGDQITLLGDRSKTIREVLSINRLTNRVYLKGIQNTGDAAPEAGGPRNEHVPYAKCQLFIGYHDFPSASGREPDNRPVFATRLKSSRPHWNPTLNRYVWNRYAAQTLPRLPEEATAGEFIQIPWPKPEKPVIPEATAYDTSAETVVQVTYHPPVFPSLPEASIDPPAVVPAEPMEYIRALRGVTPFSDQLLAELELERELSNPHSRAKKQARWQARQAYEKELLKKYVQKALAAAKGARGGIKAVGKARKEARAEAVFRWKQQLEEEKRAEKRRRWVNRGMEERLFSRQIRREKKAEKRDKALRELVLEEAPNQVIPL